MVTKVVDNMSQLQSDGLVLVLVVENKNKVLVVENKNKDLVVKNKNKVLVVDKVVDMSQLEQSH